MGGVPSDYGTPMGFFADAVRMQRGEKPNFPTDDPVRQAAIMDSAQEFGYDVRKSDGSRWQPKAERDLLARKAQLDQEVAALDGRPSVLTAAGNTRAPPMQAAPVASLKSLYPTTAR